jgi:hypothetical protein
LGGFAPWRIATARFIRFRTATNARAAFESQKLVDSGTFHLRNLYVSGAAAKLGIPRSTLQSKIGSLQNRQTSVSFAVTGEEVAQNSTNSHISQSGASDLHSSRCA